MRARRVLGASDVLWLLQGGQGATMVAVKLVFHGSDVPTCVAQDTRVTVDGKLAGESRENVSTYELSPGSRITKTLWLPGAYKRDGDGQQ